MADHRPADDDVAARAAEIRAEADEALRGLTPDASLCAISREGRSFPAGKFHEGRGYAAAEVLRGLRRGMSPREAVDAAWDRWSIVAPLPRRTAPDWAAYGAGGDDVLAELLELAG
ncbi:hypothetical protein [Nocardioides sp.]|uniref:hypothetical protein n=1 Tax=Nocardioides sp. TaxID=35761 RepID=UPI0031C4754B|nr:hypothetical protein [Gemmatimonadales bacterium]